MPLAQHQLPAGRPWQCGIGELRGEVLHENKPTLPMCRELEFGISLNQNDSSIVLVGKRLAMQQAAVNDR